MLKETCWVVEKGKGILNNKRLPNNALIEDKLTILKTIVSSKYELKDIAEFIVPILRNFQSVNLSIDFESADSKKLYIKHSNKIINILNYISNNLKDKKSLIQYQKELCGNLNAFIDSLNTPNKYDDLLRLRNTVDASVDKYKLFFKDNSEPYAHSFMSDFSRIAFSSSFRRLQDKAQVFPLEKYDYARTRLTHTMEVTSIAMQIGNLCAQKSFYFNNRPKKEFAFLFEKCLNCSSLLHDMGNPPFGHFGEDIIKEFFTNKWDELTFADFSKSSPEFIKINSLKSSVNSKDYEQMKEDFLSFDGNAQSLRVATKIQQYKVGQSLDLTAAVLGSIIKYPCNSIEGRSKQKFGYFFSEKDIINILERMGVYKNKFRNPFAMLLEAADDISYVTSDLDDAVKKQALLYEAFLYELQKFEKQDDLNEISKEFCSNFHKYYQENCSLCTSNPFEYTIQRMSNDLRNNLIKEVVKTFCDNTTLIFEKGIYYKKVDNNCDISLNLFDGKYNELLDYIPSSQLTNWIKDTLFKKYIYNNSNILKSELEGFQILSYLLDQFSNAILNLDFSLDNSGNFMLSNRGKYGKKFFKHEKIFNLISKNFVDVYKSESSNYQPNSLEEIYYRLKLVVDYVSGMTDSYALDIYRTLKGI